MIVCEKENLPRERLERSGPEGLSTEDLLALVLGRGNARKNVFALSEELAKFLSQSSRRPTLAELCRIQGLGKAKAAQILACLELSSRFFIGTQMTSITTPAHLVARLSFLKFKSQECFTVVSLSSANGVLGIHLITEGLVNSTQVHAREVFAEAIRDRATGIILAHNYPSGSLMASENDKAVTRSLSAAGRLLDIPILDHLIISFRGYVSLKRDFPELFDGYFPETSESVCKNRETKLR